MGMDLLAVARTECFLGSWMVEKQASTVFYDSRNVICFMSVTV
jgi:hypothetical protein